MVGGSRINVVDPRKIPLYLSRNVSFIRQHAVTALQTHFKYTHCATGALETLAPDDYSISFSWASLTDLGRQLNPYGRSDLPLAYSAYDNLITPLWLSKEDSFPTYVVNVFIQLQEATRRAPAVIQKAREEEQVRAEIAARPQKVVNINRPMNPGYNNNNRTDARIQKAVVATASATASAVGASISEAMKRAAPYERTYPPLPVGAPPEWNRDAKMVAPVWKKCKRIQLGDTRAEDTAIRFIRRPIFERLGPCVKPQHTRPHRQQKRSNQRRQWRRRQAILDINNN